LSRIGGGYPPGVGSSQAGDVVLLAGKGHEKEQILADRTIPFDDTETALSELGKLGYVREQ